MRRLDGSSKGWWSPIAFNTTKKSAVIKLFFAFVCSLPVVGAYSADIAFAGFAYSGDYQSSSQRFPYSKKFETSLGAAGINGLLRKALPGVQPVNYKLTSRIEELAGRDQAVAVALVVTNETVTTEQIGAVYKLFVHVRGQAMFFDFKSKTVLRAYPFSFAYLDALPDAPSESQKVSAISKVYLGTGGKAGVLDRFYAALTQATIPDNVSRFVQVSNVIIEDEARTEFPAQYGNGVAETWVADTFAEAIAGKMGIPMLPYSKGYAIGNVMSLTVADGTVFNLKLPEPDYAFTIDISKLRKVVFEEKAAGKSLIYGTYASIKLEEPLSAHTYMKESFKNGEVKVVPASQVNTEDFPAFQDSMRGLFTKLSSAVAGESSPWLKAASSGNDIDKQIASTRELLQSCK
ncbi:MAG TPA: hypothetical protein VGM52_16715 [Herbaspirillum sp.]|jgi:hypothetical protein